MIGSKFSFHVEFQDWLKTHAGLRYQDAVDAWYDHSGTKEADRKRRFRRN
ncbi:MAG: DUF6434 domain-containing protein [[Clostridium] innocuum]